MKSTLKLQDLNTILEAFDQVQTTSVDIIFDFNPDLRKAINLKDRELIIDQLLADSFIQSTLLWGRGTGGQFYCITDHGKKFLKAGGYITEKEDKKKNKNYSHKQIAIAYCVANEAITTENAAKILSTHSQTKSVVKFLTKRMFNASQLTTLSDNKTADTKHLNDLIAAKQLLSGRKKKEAVKDISRIITAFETAYRARY